MLVRSAPKASLALGALLILFAAPLHRTDGESLPGQCLLLMSDRQGHCILGDRSTLAGIEARQDFDVSGQSYGHVGPAGSNILRHQRPRSRYIPIKAPAKRIFQVTLMVPCSDEHEIKVGMMSAHQAPASSQLWQVNLTRWDCPLRLTLIGRTLV